MVILSAVTMVSKFEWGTASIPCTISVCCRGIAVENAIQNAIQNAIESAIVITIELMPRIIKYGSLHEV